MFTQIWTCSYAGEITQQTLCKNLFVVVVFIIVFDIVNE